ncbi:MAG: arginine deiminase-related protein [Pseudomonadota bacterium]
MIRPAKFQFNPETRDSNAFQSQQALFAASKEQELALAEFEQLSARLSAAGVRVVVIDDTPEPHTPDSIFPNNWISTHSDGTVFVYPMATASRRLERRQDVIELLRDEYQFQVQRLVDLSDLEKEQVYLEGTGSMVLDRINKIAFAAQSDRTHQAALQRFSELSGYQLHVFDANGPDGAPIYHTNVLMCIGSAFSVLCLEALRDSAQREALARTLRKSGRDIVEISLSQMSEFAGNMLELKSSSGEPVLAMSSRAHASLSDSQRAALAEHCTLVHSPITMIEKLAGGSVRCMLAELHLPPAN